MEIYQNCPIFNDGAFDAIKGNDTKADAIIPLVHGEPIRFGAPTSDRPRRQGLVRDTETGGVEGRPGRRRRRGPLLVHDAHNPDPSTAFAISRLTDAGYLNQSPIGIFRQVERPTYDDQARGQIADAAATTAAGGPTDRLAALSTAATPGPSSDLRRSSAGVHGGYCDEHWIWRRRTKGRVAAGSLPCQEIVSSW